jgi:hypothetical protein
MRELFCNASVTACSRLKVSVGVVFWATPERDIQKSRYPSPRGHVAFLLISYLSILVLTNRRLSANRDGLTLGLAPRRFGQMIL